jgi:3-methyladenine DNA glycosylase Mpg
MPALPDSFFDRDAQTLAKALLGKVIRHRVGDLWLVRGSSKPKPITCRKR